MIPEIEKRGIVRPDNKPTPSYHLFNSKGY
jgi:hypothetical protein